MTAYSYTSIWVISAMMITGVLAMVWLYFKDKD